MTETGAAVVGGPGAVDVVVASVVGTWGRVIELVVAGRVVDGVVEVEVEVDVEVEELGDVVGVVVGGAGGPASPKDGGPASPKNAGSRGNGSGSSAPARRMVGPMAKPKNKPTARMRIVRLVGNSPSANIGVKLVWKSPRGRSTIALL